MPVMRIVCLSDTHGLHRQITVPEGDLVLVAGDMCQYGSPAELDRFADWFRRLPHRYKIVVAGNHDWVFQLDPIGARRSLGPEVIYLEDEARTIERLKFYGSPWQPEFFDWAFNVPRGPELAQIWSRIPDDTDVLVTHGPPHGILDRDLRDSRVGCLDLANRVAQLNLRLHVFGHIHGAYGTEQRGRTTFVNASICDEDYRPVNPPIVIDLETGD